jgi:hypothetical protein
MTNEQEQKILKEARERLKKAMDDDSENRRMAKEDLEFVAVVGSQWPADVKAFRTGSMRPCLEINKMPVYIDQVVGDQRMNRPSIKVVPVDSAGDPKVARIFGGWIKHVQDISKSDVAIDHGFEHAVTCGYGALRVVTKYVSDNAFEQEAYIQKIDNALAVFWGKHSEYDCSDAMYCFIVSDMDREEFKEKYGEEPLPFDAADSQYIEGWATKDTVRLAEYFVKEPVTKTIYLLESGEVVEKVPEGQKEVRKRKVEGYKIIWRLLAGNKVLEEKDWPGKKYIPVIPIWGKEFNVAGKRYIRGLIRNSKDSQRMLNFWHSVNTEVVTMQPRVPYLVTPKQISGHEAQWDNLHAVNYNYLLVNFDEKAPGWPKREAPPQASSAMVEATREADQDIRDTMGLQRASLGMQSNERSGKAIIERKKEGDVGTYAFVDNLARSIEHLGRVLVDVAPSVLDTERVVRLGLANGEYEQEAVNVEDPTTGKILNDLSVGTYDIVVTVGPSFTTQRTEAAQSMQQFIQYYPGAAPLIGDLYAKAMDWPGSEEVSQRLEFLLPPEIKTKLAAEAAKKVGGEGPPPPEPPTPPPSPEQQMQMQEAQMALQESQLKLQEMQLKVEQEKEKLKGLMIKNEMEVVQSKEGIKKLIDEIAMEEIGGSTQSQIPGRADGGPVEANQLYVVGEQGPEVFVPKQDGTVVPNYGLREDGTPKGKGWLGELKRPDGKVSTELSLGFDFGGKHVLAPALVPTLTQDEVTYLLNGGKPTPEIVNKAAEHAKMRMQQGLSPFKD